MRSVTCVMFNCTFLRFSHGLASNTITLRNNVKNVIITMKSKTLGFPHLRIKKKTGGKIGLSTEIIRFHFSASAVLRSVAAAVVAAVLSSC